MILLGQIIESSKLALSALKSNILRTVLSLLGVSIGIFAIIIVFTVVDSLEKSIKSNLSFLGSDVVYVERWPWDFVQNPDYPWWKYWQRPKATYEEYNFLKKNLNNNAAIAISRAKRGVTLNFEHNSVPNAGLQGVSVGFDKIADIALVKGRYFSAQEIQYGSNTIILGYEIAESLFGTNNPVGKIIKKNGLKFSIIGVVEKTRQ